MSFHSNENPQFRSELSETIFKAKYAHEGANTWSELAETLVLDVCEGLMNKEETRRLQHYIDQMKFIPGGRYLYYAGRKAKFFSNCFLFKAKEDTREDWADLSHRVESALMTGGGIGVDYSVYRCHGSRLGRTGGIASGPLPKMKMINEIGRNVMQGGSRRSAMYASLHWKHGDVGEFLKCKNWGNMPIGQTGATLWDAKQDDFNFPCPMDMTNISVNYDTEWLLNYWKTGDVGDTFRENVYQAMRTSEPGFSFNFFDKENETLRNAPVSGDTYVLTSVGYVPVSSIVDTPISVWTGKQWVETTFKKTKTNTPTKIVIMTSGHIKADPDHEFLVEGSLGVERVPAKDLKESDTLHVSFPEEYNHTGSSVRVLSVEDGPNEDVFCCDVGVEEHSFCAEGVIISNCTEVTSEDDSDLCNLGSVNMGRIDTIDEFRDIVDLATKFLICGTMTADVPFEEVRRVREKNRRVGLGLMGIHEWLIKAGERYEVTPELHRWLSVYKHQSDQSSVKFADEQGISRPVANRAIAPTGTIAMVAGTTTGIEPLFAVAYKRRYLKNGTEWHYQYTVDSAAQEMIDVYGADPDKLEGAVDLSEDFERRIKFQADVQDYVDMAISSTINLPAWGTKFNNESRIDDFAYTLAKYAHRLRGFTCYADGSRGGQPLTPIDYHEAKKHLGEEFREGVQAHDICDISGKGGTCGA